MEIYESIFRVSHGGLVILDYGDALLSTGIALNGSHVIESAHFMRAAGMRNFARGGEENSLEFTTAEPAADTGAAVKAALDHAVTVPRTVDDLLIELETGERWTVASAAVKSWAGDSQQGEGIIGARTYSVVGGVITADHSIDAPVYLQPDGYKYFQPI